MRKYELIDLIDSRLADETTSIVEQWKNPQATTTKHFFVDNLLPTEVSQSIFDAFPRDGSGFFSRDSFREKKRTSANLDAYNPILASVTYAIQDKRIVERISKLVGFDRLDPDPKLYAGGLSMMFKEDFLNPHIDNSHDADRLKYRRLNLLYYVSPDWQLEYGGNLELWNSERTIPKTIVARFNRLVVMETNKTTWHSVSPVTVDQPRCCVSNYYFSDISPEIVEYFHVTSFTGRPDEKFKRAAAIVDNTLRNAISKTFKVGRGKDLVNKEPDASK